MPTFKSITSIISSDLAGRLVFISDTNVNPNNAVGDSSTDVNSDNNQYKINSLDTPQSCLSRHPLSLRIRESVESETLSRDPDHCHGFPELRKAVAQELVILSLPGQRHAMMKSVLEKQQQQDCGDDGFGEENDVFCSSFRVFPGNISALDMLQYQRTISAAARTAPTRARGEEMPMTLSTGSKHLDLLLGIPPQKTTFLSPCWDQRLCIMMPSQALPWGHVLQCSGPSASGKTQLALSLTARAIGRKCSVLYIASAFGHGSLRSLVLRLRHFLASTMTTTREQFTDMLDNLVFFQAVQDGHEVLTCLAELEHLLLAIHCNRQASQSHPSSSSDPITRTTQCPPRVVVLDAASGCLTAEDETLLQRVALRLKHLARHYHLLVWVNNTSTVPTSNLSFSKHNVTCCTSLKPGMDVPPSATTTATTSRKNSNSPDHRFEASEPPKPKVALGFAWKKMSDIHVSLQRFPPSWTKKTVMARSCQRKQVRQSREEQYFQQKPDSVIRATLEAHPFKRCNRNCNPMTADFRLTAQGIQDHEPASA